MSNILHEIKRGFLIIGLTGPLNSGCSTAAYFFTDLINEYIEKKTQNALPRFERRIRKIYRKIFELKESLKKPKISKSEKEKEIINLEIQELSTILKEYLHLRETLTVLKDYKTNNFRYISMTDMLVKLTIENLIEADDIDIIDELKLLKSKIDFDKNKFEKVKEVNKLLRERKLYNISKADNDIFEEFLNYISDFRGKLKDYCNANELGSLLQDLGDNARRCGNPIDYDTNFKKENASTLFILSKEANNIIKFYRNRKRSEFEGKTPYKEFVIEAFRNPYEVEYLRNRYYEFFLFSIFSPSYIREKRPKWNKERDKRDQGYSLSEKEFYKQNVSKCVYLSDIAINNTSGKPRLAQKLTKFFALICRPGCISPSSDEMFMHQAYSMSVKSNCISRQVGAVIVGPKGYIVGAGWNDVGSGQVACGLRKYKDIQKDFIPFPIAVKGEEDKFFEFMKPTGDEHPNHSFCFKDEYSRFKTSSKVEKLEKDDHALNEWKEKYKITSGAMEHLTSLVIRNFSPKRLEYCRALHAEENAILQNSILGGMGIEGGTIYSTTFPCELCAKKIYQSRIKKVIYTEPYPESISEDVFFKDGAHTIELLQFQGVKSHSYYRLYKASVDQKEFQIQERLY